MDCTIVEVVGEEVVPLVHALKEKKNFSEFKLAERLDKDVNATRSLLYRLLELGLVSFIRRKDKKKGWYICYWTFKPRQLKKIRKDLRERKINALKERFEREKNSNFFICEDKCARLDFDQAVDFNFKCPECGKLMGQEDNTERIKKIKEEILSLEK